MFTRHTMLRRWFQAFAAVAAMVLATPAWTQTPLRDGGNKGVIRWADNSFIDVYIPADPNGLGRDASLRDGIVQWNDRKPLKDHNIQIRVHLGDPPAGTTKDNAVIVKWAAPGSINGGKSFGLTGPSYDENAAGNTATGGEMDIDRSPGDVDNKMATNLGIHEMGHALGLDDDDATPGSAMNSKFTKTDTKSISAADDKELSSVFAANSNDTNAHVVATVLPMGPNFLYQYDVTWLSGGNLAAFQIDTHGANIFDIHAADGWRVDDFVMGADVSLLPQDLRGESFLGFVHAQPFLYLDADHPSLSFSFESDRGPATATAFLNGRFETVAPTTVPEPSTAALVLIGLTVLACSGRRRQTH